MNTEEHALDIESHLISDMTKTLRANGISPGVIGPEGFTLLVDELARDAMLSGVDPETVGRIVAALSRKEN